MLYNDVEDDMRSEKLDIYGMCLGPFPSHYNFKDCAIKLIQMDKGQKQKVFFSLEKWIEWNTTDVNRVIKWFKLDHAKGKESFYLYINFYRLEQRVQGVFGIKFKTGDVSFYCWLDTSAILWNEKLKSITIAKNRQEDPLELPYISEIPET